MTILQNQYVLAVHDIRTSAAFYVDALGFEIVAQPEGWIFVRKDNCVIMLGECPDDMHPSLLGCHNYFSYLRVDEEVPEEFEIIVNCAGFGASSLVPDAGVKPHRGQVAISAKLDFPAMVCEETLTYVIPRSEDCILGGSNDVSADREPSEAHKEKIVRQCREVLNLPQEPHIIDNKVGLRPFRHAGVRVASSTLSDGRTVIHNYGHGGSGFTLSWGCAHNVLELIRASLKGF